MLTDEACYILVDELCQAEQKRTALNTKDSCAIKKMEGIPMTWSCPLTGKKCGYAEYNDAVRYVSNEGRGISKETPDD